jgi:hypothetical protein
MDYLGSVDKTINWLENEDLRLRIKKRDDLIMRLTRGIVAKVPSPPANHAMTSLPILRWYTPLGMTIMQNFNRTLKV